MMQTASINAGTVPLRTRVSSKAVAQPFTGSCGHLVLKQRHARQHKALPTTFRPQAVAAVEAPPPPPAAPTPDDGPSVADLKAQLLDSLFGTERGLSASSEVRAEINELITQLEAKNPNPSLMEAEKMLEGQWKLVYTSSSEISGLLALSRLPFVAVGDITQKIEASTLTVENKVALTVPFSRTSFSTSASFEVRSPKRLQVRFERGTVATPELLQDVELPSSVTVLGQPIDLTSLKEALQPAQSAAQGAIARLAQLVSQQPDLQFPISSDRAQAWLINTFLDADTRISRGDGGSVFVLVKDVSFSSPIMGLDSSTTAIVPVEDAPFSGVAPPAYLSEVTTDPLEEFCKDAPDADECRVYED